MAQHRRIMVTIPNDLLASVDNLLLVRGKRSAFVREALCALVKQRQAEMKVQAMRSGYERMGPLNRQLAEEGLAEDIGALLAYERALGERESG